MLELLIIFLFCGFFFKAAGLAFRMAWGVAKIIASILFAVAVPLLVVCLVFAGGVVLFVPLLLVSIAFGILRACC